MITEESIDNLAELVWGKGEFDMQDLKSVFQTVKRAFYLMSIAEEEIKKAMLLHEEDEELCERINKSFLLLCPVVPNMDTYDDTVYRHHCQELLDRVIRGVDDDELSYPTKAEILVMLSEMALESPLKPEPAALYTMLFRDLFGPNTTNRLMASTEVSPSYQDTLNSLSLNSLYGKICSKVKLERMKPNNWQEDQNAEAETVSTNV